MNARIQGIGWVTPLGTGLDDVLARLRAGERAEPVEVSSPHSIRRHRCVMVPPKLAEAAGRNPRLRRSSAISCFTATAALAAIEDAGIKMTPEIAERTAIVFAIASGGVVYTRKFYETVVTQGARAASPLLFPETVYNAPASHLAALLGVTGMTYTLVGDPSVGIAALKFAEQLLETQDIDRCVVAGGEELDWVLCEAYRAWRCPMLLAEGAAALVLGRDGNIALDPVHDGVSFFNRREGDSAVRRVFGDLQKGGPVDLVVCGGNGGWFDAAERASLAEFFPGTPAVDPKQSLGEALGAGALIQTVYGAMTLRERGAGRVLVSAPGLNQQASGLVLTATE